MASAIRDIYLKRGMDVSANPFEALSVLENVDNSVPLSKNLSVVPEVVMKS